MTSNVDVKYDITSYNGTPGKPWDDFEERLLNALSKAYDRGWSYADHLLGNNKGSATHPALPGAGTADGS